jgi:hypothetical protein
MEVWVEYSNPSVGVALRFHTKRFRGEISESSVLASAAAYEH